MDRKTDPQMQPKGFCVLVCGELPGALSTCLSGQQAPLIPPPIPQSDSPRGSLVGGFHSITDVFDAPVCHVGQDFASVVEDCSGTHGVWPLLGSPVVQLVSLVHAASRRTHGKKD